MGMAGHLYRGGRWDSTREALGLGSIEFVTEVAFCEKGHCPDLAVWRIGYGSQSVELCPRHAVATMRNRRLWLAR